MSNKRLKTITFPGLDDVYTIPDEAPEYSASATYKVGDFVVYGGALYKCNTAIESAEDWTAAHWTVTKMGNEVSGLQTAITENTANLNNVSVGRYAPNTTTGVISSTSSNNYFGMSEYIPCEANTEYTVKEFDATPNTQPRILFLDALNNVLLYSTGTSNGQDTFTSPANAVKMTAWFYRGQGIAITDNSHIVIVKGAVQIHDYIPPITAVDFIARNNSSDVNNKVNCITKQFINGTGIGYDSDDFEIGGITISSSGWEYVGSSTRVRTKQNKTYHLKSGDVIGLTSYANAQFFVGWYVASEDTYGQYGWVTQDYVVKTEGDYVILLSNVVETDIANKYTLLDMLFIKRKVCTKSVYELPYFNNGKIRLHAHKGLFGNIGGESIPENSTKAYETAGKNKIFICEADIRQTSDGKYVCIHNDTVDSTTSGTGTVSEMTFDEIRALYLLNPNGTTSELKVPSVEEYLVICKKYNMIAAMELKTTQDTDIANYMSGLLEIIEDYGMTYQCLFIVNISRMRYIRSISEIPCNLIADSDSFDSVLEEAIRYPYIGVAISYEYITAAMIESCHTNKIPITVFVINTTSDADTYFGMGADVIGTDILTENEFLS